MSITVSIGCESVLPVEIGVRELVGRPDELRRSQRLSEVASRQEAVRQLPFVSGFPFVHEEVDGLDVQRLRYPQQRRRAEPLFAVLEA